MKLIWLSRENLGDNFFIRDLAHHFDKKQKAILLHDSFGESDADTRFVTRRISAVLSEALIVNFAQSGEQRGLFTESAEGSLMVRKDLIERSLLTVNLFITNHFALSGNAVLKLEPQRLLQTVRSAFPDTELIFFPANSRSPLGREVTVLNEPLALEGLLPVYEEEAAILNLAASLSPARIASPANMWAR